ncbi:Molybdenum cofactor sulfurase [Trichinella spiralis]|uniref:Molybdenum cofactor sulfurase n=1 Tax=Trichinella spiralis TaxID=6334 RepID=A0A0V1BS77_TRISP|nr:Molybdenum cofactor sulfurase [Trichinella spiralis]KRY39548.1 Molybdenum cofactor sulfurase [Trichinella spiralis]
MALTKDEASQQATYLDNAGAARFYIEQFDQFINDMQKNHYGNPHSGHASGKLTASRIAEVRERILKHFGTDSSQHCVVFTSSCTAALKLVGECFAYSSCAGCSKKRSKLSLNNSRTVGRIGECKRGGCRLVYLFDNHTSVIGMREYAWQRDVGVVCVSEDELVNVIDRPEPTDHGNESCNCTALFVYPGQSNFSGRKYPLDWCERISSGGMLGPQRWYTCIDGAALLSSSRPQLGAAAGPDFLACSFYKMFGFPTGIGALVIRRKSAHLLQKVYYGGGTVEFYLPNTDFHVFRQNIEERFEDGSLPYHLVIALQYGFDELERFGGVEKIGLRIFNLAKLAYDRLLELKHGNGNPVAEIYCNNGFRSPAEQGGIINFNLLDRDGQYVACSEVERMATLFDVQLRSGYFCNIGACQLHLNLTDEDIRKNFQNAVEKDNDETKKPRGSVRISFGWNSNESDVDSFINFIVIWLILKYDHQGRRL